MPLVDYVRQPFLLTQNQMLTSLNFAEVEFPFGSGIFVDVESGGRHECIINAGDCLQKWTGLHSTRHRVHLPKPPDSAGVNGLGDGAARGGQPQAENAQLVDARYSIAYFAKPDRSVSLRPLLGGRPGDGEKDMTAGEFQQMRISGTYASG